MLRLCSGAAWHDLWQPMSSLQHGRFSSKSFALIRTVSNSLSDYAALHPKAPKVVLKKGKTQIFKTGNPMVYSNAVDRIIGRPPPETGDLVLVTDGTIHPIAWGVYNTASMFCVRIMEREDEVSRNPSFIFDMEKLLKSRIASALDLRLRLGLPSNHTNVYRLVNSEGDRLSGLIVDVFGEYAVVASSAAWVEKLRPAIEDVLKLVARCKYVVWRSSPEILKEEGFGVKDSDDVQTQSSSTSEDGSTTLEVVENGICYKVVLNGQKTGFYVDQRESRFWLRSVVKDRSVLDLCCYSGGFALNAAVGEALEVTGVDSSAPAIELALANKELNKLSSKVLNFVKADISEYLKGAIFEGRTWDIVVLDPPKLAPSRKVLQRAMGMYRNLNTLAMRCVEPGGLLMTCSCSGAMTQSGSFPGVLQASASSTRRKIKLLRSVGAASDHTLDLSYPEGAYLTNIVVTVD
ncbi:hypothetical protein GOP47_0011737 [Adiantum capillus-veneris]|uniref:PUA domain-containing protein n=1 Tax=Adiantum capillus-veneris TaxID=13818 RepID=A0A9D4UTR4_ADICA|nr:hypothetical protein GOP47_0011737 [Adiantum capillus-veneris]